MRIYCRAYLLGDVRQFPDWTESAASQALPDDHVCYIWDDFSVVLSPIQEDSCIFEGTSADWKEFCQASLAFAIPEEVTNINSAH